MARTDFLDVNVILLVAAAKLLADKASVQILLRTLQSLLPKSLGHWLEKGTIVNR